MKTKNNYVTHIYTFNDDTLPTKTITFQCKNIDDVKKKVKKLMNGNYYQMVCLYNGNCFEKFYNN
jgi:hypothetical protein